jgi:hypothetical protein
MLAGEIFVAPVGARIIPKVSHGTGKQINFKYKGVKMNQSQESKNEKLIAFLLCLFLGYFGIHKFYQKKNGLGVLYLFTFGIFGIGWIVDIIVLGSKLFNSPPTTSPGGTGSSNVPATPILASAVNRQNQSVEYVESEETREIIKKQEEKLAETNKILEVFKEKYIYNNIEIEECDYKGNLLRGMKKALL